MQAQPNTVAEHSADLRALGTHRGAHGAKCHGDLCPEFSRDSPARGYSGRGHRRAGEARRRHVGRITERNVGNSHPSIPPDRNRGQQRRWMPAARRARNNQRRVPGCRRFGNVVEMILAVFALRAYPEPRLSRLSWGLSTAPTGRGGSGVGGSGTPPCWLCDGGRWLPCGYAELGW
jgi:hypothetical protein